MNKMYIIKRNHDMPYYVGTNENGVISWSSKQSDARQFKYFISAEYYVNKLFNKTQDRTIEAITKPIVNLN